MRKIFIITGIILLVLISLIVIIKKHKTKVKYLEAPLKRTTITQIVEASGTINPVTTVSIGSQVSGMIKEIYVDYNSKVKKGQLLAKIDPALFEAQVEQAQANINNARANLAKILATTENDRKTYLRYKNLYAKNFVAKSELDLAESNYLADKAQVNAARAQIAQAAAALKTAQSNLDYTKIVSSVDGIVISRSVDVGQTVAASFQTPTLFSVAQDLTKMQIETSVSEADIGNVKVGQEATYTLDGYPDTIFKGRVTQVRISPTTVSNVVTYNVIIQVDNKEGKLIPGMSANVSIITGVFKDVLCAPNTALRFTPFVDGSGPKYKNPGLWVLKKGKPERIEVEFGASDDDVTQILSKNLNENDFVITGFDEGKKSKNKKMPMRMF